MFSKIGKSLKNLYDEAFNFEYADEDEDDGYRKHRLSTSNNCAEFSAISTIQLENDPVSSIPCEFCGVLWNRNLLLSHQISCPRNPTYLRHLSAPYAPLPVHERVRPTLHRTSIHPTTTSSAGRGSTDTDGLYSLRCSITQELFVDPVLAEDGHTYERSAIEQWIEKKGISPNTREPLTVAGLRPNLAVRNAVEELRTKNNDLNERSSNRSITIPFKYEINVDVRKTTERPFARTFGKSLYHAEWITPQNQCERLVLLHITGDRAVKEAQLNVQLPPHPHIVRTFGLVKHNDEGMLLLQEYAEQGSLLDLLHTEHHPPTPEVIHGIILQIVDALIFLTQQSIVHGDLACRNVLVFQYDRIHPSRNLVKLTDFGISRRSGAVTSLDIVANLSSAPEVLRSKVYSEKSDAWAFAVLAWEIYSKGTTPMVSQAHGDFNENDRRILAGVRLRRPSACPSPQWGIFLQCMEQDPDRRPTFVQLREKLRRS